MADKTINTVIVLRNDSTTAWETSSYILKSGEVGVGYLDVVQADNSVKKVPIIKVGDNTSAWNDLPQAEGVFMEDQILTYNFGRHTISNGYVNAGGKGMTTSEWLLDALSEVLNPITNNPTASLKASTTITTDTGDLEIGAKIKAFGWDGSHSKGSYKDATNTDTYGTSADKTSSSSGIADSDFTWSVTNSITSATGTTEDGTFTIASSDDYIQIDSTNKKTYALLNGEVTVDVSNARIPLNNIGAEYNAGKIIGFDANGTTKKTFTEVAVEASGFRKPFWGWKSTAEALANPAGISAVQIRALGKSGPSTSGLPTSLTVPADTKQIFFAAKAGTKSSLTVKNVTKEPATSVACTPVPSATLVSGANNYGWDAEKQEYTTANGACAYDVWYINLDAAFTGETKLSLTWA